MKLKIKKLTAITLSLLMIITLLPTTVFAAGSIASVNGTEYSKINDAWNKVKSGGTITMLADWKLDDVLTLNDNAKVTVEMNGHIINRGLANTDYDGGGDGQIFFVNDGASLTVNGGSSVDHIGYIDGDLWFSGSKSGKEAVKLTGGVLTGGACDDSDGAGAISMRKNTTVTLNGVNVVGNLSDCYFGSYGQGGAIRMYDPDGTLNLNGTKIMYNHAEDDGGAIYIQDEPCTVNMVNSVISHNYADGDGGGIYSNDDKTTIRMSEDSRIESNTAEEGGGIYLNYSQFYVKSSDTKASIINNKARDGHGGGIYAESAVGSNYGTIHGIDFIGNSAKKYGGAMYLNSESIAVSACNIAGNTADCGAGIYIDNDNNTISACTITGNKANSAGGGVYCSSLCDIALSGKVIIKDNTRQDNSKDDLFLNESTVATAYIVGAPSGSSEVGIRVADQKERIIGKEARFYYENAFFYDLNDYHIEFNEDNGNLRLAKGAKEIIPVAVVSPEAVQTDIFNGQPLIRGYFSYPSVVESYEDLDAVFYYSDGYFLNGDKGNYGDPKNYNPHLATMSMSMAMAGFYSNIGNDGTLKSGSDRTYTYKSQNIERLFNNIGITADNIYISDSNTVKPGTETIGVAIGQKSIGADGEILIPIAIRGAGYESEWYGNTTIGTSGEHEGFAIAADQVFGQVQSYINEYGLSEAAANGKLKFWIAGYSRAGATSNLTARRLIEAYCGGIDKAAGNCVYAYCFEAPKGGLNSEMRLSAENYYSIHNCINQADLVPLVAPEEMGFIRYGVDHFVPGAKDAGEVKSSKTVWSYVKGQDWANSYETWYDNSAWMTDSKEYSGQRARMLDQLKSIDSVNICFYDRFSAATIAYVKSYFGFDLVEKIDDTSLTQEKYIRILLRALQAWGFYGSYNRDFRSSFANTSSADTTDSVTFQQALQTVTKAIFSKSSDELTGIMDAAGGTMDRLNNSDDIDLYDIWNDMIGDWCTLNQEERSSYAETLWKIVVEGKDADGKAVEDYLTAAEKTELHRIWYTLLDVLLRFTASDYEFDADEWNESHAMVSDKDGKYHTTPITENIGGADNDDCQVLLGTLAYNASILLQAHYPEINLAWLRSYDSFFESEAKKPIDIAQQTAPAAASYISKDGTGWETAADSYDGSRLLAIVADTDGAAVFYRIKVNDGEYSPFKPFNKPILLAPCNNALTNYTVETTAVFCGSVSAPVQKEYSIKPTYAVTVTNGTASAGDTQIAEAAEGTLLTLAADAAAEGQEFDRWIVEAGAVILTDETDAAATFLMPAEEVALKATYKKQDRYEKEIVSVNGAANGEACAYVNEDIEVIFKAPAGAAKAAVMAETGRWISVKSAEVTATDDVTDTWKVIFAVGTKGKRELSIYLDYGEGLTDSELDVNVTINKVYAEPEVIAIVESPEQAVRNALFHIRVRTNAAADKLGIFNENGAGVGKTVVDKTADSDGSIIWTVSLAVSSVGSRTYQVKAQNSAGEWVDGVCFDIKINRK